MKWDRSKGRPEPIRALNKILERENGEPLVDLRQVAPSLLAMRPGTLTWCRQTVAEMAEQAARALPRGLKFGYSEAWRPLVRQTLIYDAMWNWLAEARPGLDRVTMRRIVCKWVAPVDQKAPPGHCTGAALDLYLLDSQNEPMDVISPFSRFQAGPTYVYGLTEDAQRNRDLLVNTLLEAGFSNCRDEFWHYSYGDAGWAVRTGQSTCHYGLVELDPKYWSENQALWESTFYERPNPFLS